jgi:DNA-binding protein H-NS
MDVSQLSIPELEALQTRIPGLIAKKKAEEKQSVIDEAKALITAKGFTLEDLFGKTIGTRKGAPRGPVAIKYRHPQNGNLTWKGRGRKPDWILEWVNSGKTIEELAV